MEKQILSERSRIQLFNADPSPVLSTTFSAQWLLEHANLPFLIHTLPAHSVYSILQAQDLQENLEILEWLRGTQLKKVLDFDVWEYSHTLESEDISQNSALAWIHAWLSMGKEFTAERFFELDEEVALLMLTKFFVILPEGISHITDDVRENWTATPDKRFFINPTSNDGTEFEVLTEFIHALYSASIEKAGFLFSAASMLVRQETLEFAQKWRSARLADQGFVSIEEAYALLFSTKNDPKPLASLRPITRGQNFLADDAGEQIQEFLSKLEPEDGVHLLKQALSTENIKQITGSENSSIDHLYDDSDFILDSVHTIVNQAQKTLYSCKPINKTEKSESLLVEKILTHFSEKDLELFALVKQKIAYITNTVASLLAPRKPYYNSIVETSASFVRGAINIGFEECLHVSFNNISITDDVINSGIEALEEFGIDTIFKIGFNSVLNLQKALLNALSENNFISVKTRQAAYNWITSDKYAYSTEGYLALEGVLRTLPMVHNDIFAPGLSSSSLPTHLSQKYKPFESRREIKAVYDFVENIKYNLK